MFARLAVLWLAAAACLGGMDAGVARVKITPEGPAWMAGYANRLAPSEGVHDELWAKALALRDGGGVVLIVTADVIGLPRNVTEVVAARVGSRHGLPRSRIVFNASHTHTGRPGNRRLRHQPARVHRLRRQAWGQSRWAC